MQKTTRLLFTLTALVTASVLLTGCGPQEQEAAPEGDLAQASDIFKTPGATAMQPPADPATVLVTVDDSEITQGDVDAEINAMLTRSGRSLPPERVAQMRAQMSEQVIDSLIIRTLLRNAIDAENVVVEDAEIDEGLARLQASLPPGVTMEQQLTRMQLTEAELKEALSLDLRINKLIMAKVEDVADTSDEDIASFYEENKDRFQVPETVSARHILVTVKPTDDEETKAAKKAKIDAVHKQLVDGADFAELATAESDCPSSARGGDLGTFGRGQMVPAFEEAAFTQPIGEIGEIVETRFGYHVIRVDEKKDARVLPLEEASERIADGLLKKHRQEILEEYLETLKAASTITYADK